MCFNHLCGSSLPGVVCSHTGGKERGLVCLSAHLVQPPHFTDEETESHRSRRLFPRSHMALKTQQGLHEIHLTLMKHKSSSYY